ncbi:MAG: hypothetical protein ACXW24_08160 [Telluria sp.]
MSTAYQHLALADVRPGMILSDSLLDQHGQLLLPQGTVLTAATIALLPRHDIDTVPVLRPGGADSAPPDPEVVRQRVAHLFRKNDIDNQDDWATATLRRYIENYRLQREIAE